MRKAQQQLSKMDAYEQGRDEWNADIKRRENPYELGSEEYASWDEGWVQASEDSSQFGVGA